MGLLGLHALVLRRVRPGARRRSSRLVLPHSPAQERARRLPAQTLHPRGRRGGPAADLSGHGAAIPRATACAALHGAEAASGACHRVFAFTRAAAARMAHQHEAVSRCPVARLIRVQRVHGGAPTVLCRARRWRSATGATTAIILWGRRSCHTGAPASKQHNCSCDSRFYRSRIYSSSARVSQYMPQHRRAAAS